MAKRTYTGPNDPCWCGQGRKYKHCHRAVDEAPPERRYGESQRTYAANWRVTADLQHARGDYAWMAEQISGRGVGRLVDVGCGTGQGLLALLDVLGPGLRVVAADENAACLGHARTALREAGVDVAAVVERVRVAPAPGGYRQVAEPFADPLPGGVALVQADVCDDPDFVAALVADGPFDAVTVWLSGVHMLRQENAVVRVAGIDSDHAHRLFVQNAAYVLADRVLRPGGVLQVVDRVQAPSSDLLRNDLLRAHGEQAGPTRLEVQSLTWRPWIQPEHRRVPMVQRPGLAGLAAPTDLALTSVVSVRR